MHLAPVPQVYMSTRGGAWVIRQVSDNGLPVDMKYNTRFVHILFQLLPINFFNWFGEGKLNAMYDHTMYAIKPTHRYCLWVLKCYKEKHCMQVSLGNPVPCLAFLLDSSVRFQ